MENAHLSVTVLLDEGGDILNLTHKQTGADVLWKVPYPVREPGVGPPPAGDSFAQWLHYYRGGWQTILPNFGREVTYQGATIPFHGEAARRPWQLEREEVGDKVTGIELFTELSSLPLKIERSISLTNSHACIDVVETVTNLSAQPVDCMWAHHPAFASPLLSGNSRIYTGARSIHVDPEYDVPGNDLQPGAISDWPFAISKDGSRVDLSRIPESGSGISRVVSLTNFEHAWCSLLNPSIPLGIALSWDSGVMPYMCLWQEAGGTSGFPHYGRSYTVALEPSSALFGHGLMAAIHETRTQLTLPAGASRTLHLKANLFQDARAVNGFDQFGEIIFS
jgi:hypothetical protein